MIEVNQIISRLQPGLTRDDQEKLKKEKSLSSFFSSLIHIYEEKTWHYLKSCEYGVKQSLRREDIAEDLLGYETTERTVQYAYTVLLGQNKMSLLPSLLHFLKNQNQSELLVSIGMATKTAEGKSLFLNFLVMSVFASYMARHRLFQELGNKTLRATLYPENPFSQDVPAEIPKDIEKITDFAVHHIMCSSIFPKDLFEAFEVQRKCGIVVEQRLDRFRPEQIVTKVMRKYRKQINESLQGIIFYIGTVFKQFEKTFPLPIIYSEEEHRRFFSYVDGSQKKFARTVSEAYMKSSCEATHIDIFKAHCALYQSSIASTCLPALSLLGTKVAISTDDIDRAEAELDKAEKLVNEETEHYRTELVAAVDRSIEQAHQQSDQQLRNVQFSTHNIHVYGGIGAAW